MKNINKTIKIIAITASIAVLVLVLQTNKASAFIDPINFIDPVGCIVGARDCDNGRNRNTTRVVQTTYQYPQYPTYQTTSYNNPTSPLQVSCYVSPGTVTTGSTVQWIASASGGKGSYTYNWSGSDGLSGGGSAVSRSYSTTGFKSGTVTVTSGGSSKSADCGTVNVYDNSAPSGQISHSSTYNYYTSYPNTYSYNYPYNYNYYPYNYNTYPNYYNYYSPLTATCSADVTYTVTGTQVRWNVYPSGGNGYYTYSWSGTDSLNSYYQSAHMTYYSAGQKNAYVTVSSNNQSIYVYCTPISVGYGYNYGYTYPTHTNTYVTPVVYNNQNTLDIGCYADPVKIKVNQPATWVAEVTGGVAPYTYSWTGSDGLNGNQSSVVKYYSTAGNKSAIVTITSADGKTGVRACSTNLSVTSVSGTTLKAPKTPLPVVQKETPTKVEQSASAGFSLGSIPWGWVAILIILVLFATVMYLLFNRYKV